MKLIKAFSGLIASALLAGCVPVSRHATVADGTIQNASIGFSGFRFEIPDGYELYSSEAGNPANSNELQRMAIRIYQLNEEYHPRDNELFYESFLLMSDKACFLLITLKYDNLPRFDDTPFRKQDSLPWQLMPLYNPAETRTLELGENRVEAVYTRGHAYEHKGWYYAGPKRNRMPFNYEACKVADSNRDGCILMGFALPEDSGAIGPQMLRMIEGLKF
jgi:hypothetical protein